MQKNIFERDVDAEANDVDSERLKLIQAGTKQPFSSAMSVERNPFPDVAPRKGEVV